MKQAKTWLVVTVCVCALVGAVTLLATEARGQASGTPAADVAKAKKLFAKGIGFYQKGRYKAAIKKFRDAYALWNNRKILFNIAICYAERGDRILAVTYLRRSFKGATRAVINKLRASMPARLKAVEKQVAVLVVTTNNPKAAILIDNGLAGKGSIDKVLHARRYRLEVTVGGVVKARKTIRLGRGKVFAWKPNIGPATAVAVKPPAPRPPTVEKPVVPRPPAVEKPTPAVPTPTPAKPGETTVRRKSRLGRLPIYYFIAAAVVAVGAGATAAPLGLKTNKYHSDYWSSPSRSTRDKGLTFKTATNAMIGVAAGAAAAAAVLGIFTDWKNPFGKKESESGVTLLPMTGRDAAGLTVTGGF